MSAGVQGENDLQKAYGDKGQAPVVHFKVEHREKNLRQRPAEHQDHQRELAEAVCAHLGDIHHGGNLEAGEGPPGQKNGCDQEVDIHREATQDHEPAPHPGGREEGDSSAFLTALPIYWFKIGYVMPAMMLPRKNEA